MCNSPLLPHKYLYIFSFTLQHTNYNILEITLCFLLLVYNKKNSKTQFCIGMVWEVTQFETFQIVYFNPEIDFAIRYIFAMILFTLERCPWNPVFLNMVENKKKKT